MQKQREVLTSLNKFGVSVGYNKVQRARNDLTCFTLLLLVGGWNYIKVVWKFNELPIVFDSYIPVSLKECEREARSTCEPLHFDSLSPSTKLSS